MKKLLTSRRNLLLVLCIGSLAGWAAAQSLGTPAAEAWIGRPLDMTVPARFASPDSECVHADVFYGDNRLPANRVRTTVTGTDAKRVRIQADTLIDEPIVTVSLRAGCASSVTRSYTLLPELPTDAVIAAWNRAPQAAVAAAPAVPLRMATSTAPSTSPRVRPPRAAPAPVTTARAAPAPAPRARTTKAFRQDAPAGPRLRLEPLDLPPQAGLRASTSLADPEGNAAGRATAALLWQAINADPQEVMRTSAMLQKLESDLQQLRQSTSQTRAEMAALRSRIDEAQPWYASTVLAQVLALLVLATATAAAVFWFRTRRAGDAAATWYAPSEAAPLDSVSGAVPVSQPAEMAATPVATPPVPAPAAPPKVAVPVLREPVRTVRPAVAAAPAVIDFDVAAAPAAKRPRRQSVMRVETLAATLEEVEFLASLGLGSDAMDVLKAYLQDSDSPAPLAYFELMRLCDQAEDPNAVALVRRRYEKSFGVAAPRLERLGAPLGIESLPQWSDRIIAAWGRPEVLDILEDALFAVPPADGNFTLQAGRDLVCLHDLAMALAAEGVADPAAGEGEMQLAPWAHTDDAASALAATQAGVGAEGGHHFALDFDLGAAPDALLEPQAEAPVLVEPSPADRKAAAFESQRRDRLREEDAFDAAVSSERVPVSRF